MDADFSEFSYGYAVTEELATKNKGSVIGAPRFPSLYEEGKKGGYDVQIPFSGRAIFLQFKLSNYLERCNAKEHKKGLLNVPYYRMHLRPMRHSDQHRLLLDLETSGETVFYIAPEFHLPSELNSYYLNKTIISNSAAFSPKDIGPLPDNDKHYVVYKKKANIGYICSEGAIEIPKISLKGGITSVLKKREVPIQELGETGLKRIADQMLKILETRETTLTQADRIRDIGGIRQIVKNRSIVESIGYMSRTFFNTELVILPNEF
ncbi:MAG: hypothetical protein K9K86_08005 [Pseudomonadales bacterium]|nr:hypothetical protein [Pseudomonadales bacterium]